MDKKENNKKRIIKLKTIFDFDSAHRLVGYDGACSRLHGHIWHVDLEVIGTNNDLDNNGILWDFTNRKKLKDIFDHKTILKDCQENLRIINELNYVNENNKGVFLMNENPTAEYLSMLILDELEKQNSNLGYLVRVFESPNSSCEVCSDTYNKLNEELK